MLITLYRTNASGIVSYYSLHDRQGHLFSPYTFIVQWGKGSGAGREHVYSFETRFEMDLRIRKVLREKLRDGYRVLYTYFRADEAPEIRPLIREYYVS